MLVDGDVSALRLQGNDTAAARRKARQQRRLQKDKQCLTALGHITCAMNMTVKVGQRSTFASTEEKARAYFGGGLFGQEVGPIASPCPFQGTNHNSRTRRQIDGELGLVYCAKRLPVEGSATNSNKQLNFNNSIECTQPSPQASAIPISS